VTAPETFPLTVAGVRAALRTLDFESEEIAEKLKAAGIKGTPMDECSCALAAYVRLAVPDADWVQVEAEYVRVEGRTVGVYGLDGEPFRESFRLPDGAQDFIEAFDRGEYPDLIEETPDGA
jgi:hypothetical protein